MKIYLPGNGDIEYARVDKNGNLLPNEKMDFSFLTGDVDWVTFGAKWISSKLNNGDWDYWLVMELINLYDAIGKDDIEHEFCVALYAISPDAAGEKNIQKALGCCGLWGNQYQLDDNGCYILDDLSNECIVEALQSYGISTLLWSENGGDHEKLIEEACQQALAIESLFGFFMDGPKNRIGHTGWDFIKGDLSIETAMANRKQ